MRILAIDDNKQALKLLIKIIAEVLPSAEIFPFSKPSELLGFANNSENIPCDIAFLDIKMAGMNGLEVAKRLKDYIPKINIIFVTAYTEYALEALKLHPSGYIMKVVTRKAVEHEIECLRFPVDLKNNARVYARTFGHFEIYSHGEPLTFKYNKTKELLAYLIDKNSTAANSDELCEVLWGDNPKTENQKSYLRNLFGDLAKTLKNAGIDDIIQKRYNSIAVVTEKIVCDSYEFVRGNSKCINAYEGEYMAQYSWAEMSVEKFKQNFKERRANLEVG